MKVLYVCSGQSKGNPGPIVATQAKTLEEIGIEIEYFTIYKKGLRGYLLTVERLRKYLKNNIPDLIHAHYGMSAIVAFLSKRNKKMIVSFMGDDLIGSNTPEGKVTRLSLFLARIQVFLANWAYDYSIVKSEEMYKKMSTDKVTLIPNGADLNIYFPMEKSVARKRLGINSYTKVAIFVSDPSRTEKNFKLSKKALDHLNIENLCLVPVFNKDQKQLVYYYNAADVLLLSSFHEGSPNVIKEAMACNCPIVSTDVGDVKWVLGDTEGCYLASFDPVDFSEKIQNALNFAERKGKTKGRERITQLGLDSKTIAKRIHDVYKRVLKAES